MDKINIDKVKRIVIEIEDGKDIVIDNSMIEQIKKVPQFAMIVNMLTKVGVSST